MTKDMTNINKQTDAEIAFAILSALTDSTFADNLNEYREYIQDNLRLTDETMKKQKVKDFYGLENLLKGMIKFGTFNENETKKIKEWNHDCKIEQGAIGGQCTYSFTPTNIGTIAKVKCACGQELDITDYDNW